VAAAHGRLCVAAMPLPPRPAPRPLNPEIERLLFQIKVIKLDADGVLDGLDEEQFNWNPAPGQWSIAQCFDHLNVTNRFFLKNLKEAVASGRQTGRIDDGPYSYGWFSRWFFRMNEPPVKLKVKAPQRFVPAPRRSREQVVPEFMALHDDVSNLLRDASGLDLVRLKCPSPVVAWIKFNLGMTFWILTAHDRRHIYQARQVHAAPGFPRRSKTG